MNDYKLMGAGAMALSGILAGGAAFLDSYAQAGMLAAASMVLGYGVWGLLSCYEQLADARLQAIRDTSKDLKVMNDIATELSQKIDAAGMSFSGHIDSLKKQIDEISKNHAAMNATAVELSQKLNEAGERFNIQIDNLEKTIDGISVLEIKLEELANKLDKGFSEMQTKFQSDIDNVSKLHQNMEENDVAFRNSVTADFQAIRDKIKTMYDEQQKAFKEIFNSYAEGTMDQIDHNHRDIKNVIETLSNKNEAYAMSINTSVDTLIKKLRNCLNDQMEDLRDIYKDTYELIKSQPELLRDFKNEIVDLQRKQQDINVDDLKLMERMLSGR